MKVPRNMIWLLASAVLLVNCTDDDINPGGGGSSSVDDGGKYTETTVTVNRNGEKTQTAVLRFYASMDGVPYISISDFHKVMLPQATMTVSRQGDNYVISTSGGTATVDVKADQMTTSSIVSIFDMMSLLGPNYPAAVSYDGSLYLKPKERLLLPEVATVTFDFKKYSIDLHDDGTNVYMPYATLADIYSDMNLNTTYYNDTDKELVVSSPLNLDFNNTSKIDPQHKQRVYGRKELTEAQAQYRYNELCFVFDYIYGFPGHDNELYRVGMEQCGFDAALDKAKSGAEVKKLLKSKDNAAFMLGMDGLQMLAFDRGHTSVLQSTMIDSLADVKARYQSFAAQYPATVALKEEFFQTMGAVFGHAKEMTALRKATYGSKKYIASTDKSTAVILINDFMSLDYEGWKTFYASQKTEADWETLLARDSNMVATFLSGVKQARKDRVKNVILDVTLNSGGSTDIVMTLLSLVARDESERQQVKLYSDYVITKQASTTSFVVDRNFDGKFDEADAKVDYSDLNFAILTSNYSFSCGNLMPSMMRDSGFKVMGERSGGGCCAIQSQYTPDGMPYTISCYRLRMKNAKGENIDVGVPVDIAIPVEKFYDIDYLAGKFAN